MAGTITHEWNGTILTITSDSGTSSADLKGQIGDDGPRGPQGPAGDTTAATIEVDTTLTKPGTPADAKAVGDALTAIEEQLEDIDFEAPVSSVNGKTGAVVLSAADVGALPANTVIPSTSGLATETYVNNAVATKQNKVYYNSSQPSGWKNGDIWLKPLA